MFRYFIGLMVCVLGIIPKSASAQTWGWNRGGEGSGDAKGNDVIIDKAGNIYICGEFTNTLTWDTAVLTSSGGTDAFIAKFSPDNQLLWAKKAGGTGTDNANSIAVDNSGNVYATGSFTDLAQFGNLSLTSLGGADVFTLKLDAAGNVIWVKQGGAYIKILAMV